MELSIKIKFDAKPIEKAAYDMAQSTHQKALSSQLGAFFNSGRTLPYHPEGAGHAQIREFIEQKLEELWDNGKFVKGLDKKIEQKVIEHLETAVDTFCDHQARKIAWGHFNEMLKEKANV